MGDSVKSLKPLWVLGKWHILFLLPVLWRFRLNNTVTATVLFNRIIIKKEFWDLMPLMSCNALIVHENMHIIQRRNTGAIKFWFLYRFSRRFRYRCELEAYIEGARFIHDVSAVFSSDDHLMYAADSYARLMCGRYYFIFGVIPMVSYSKALADLVAAFEKVKAGIRA